MIHRVSCPNIYRRPDGMSVEEYSDHLVDEFKAKIEELGAENVAAFFAEPIMGAGGVQVPPPGYLQNILRCAGTTRSCSWPMKW